MIPYLTVSLGLFVLHSAWAAMFGYHLGMVMILLLAGYKVDFKGIIRNRRPAVILLMMLFGQTRIFFVMARERMLRCGVPTFGRRNGRAFPLAPRGDLAARRLRHDCAHGGDRRHHPANGQRP